ncbi:murein biosynthesis integral membrane protein MurJ [Myxococcota bacterium]|nr:murein biosynthesis integral membrane protein MurJ [Myxococcota bacterium]MBU1379368.1 murein biosynthesis integral membrane protein MurJ [Myxococcota bacterium]MBU1497028.1 murein biosynthesis integral membrane protein MurJ [Myxococcota bacterium]
MEKKISIVRAAGIVSIFTLLSRIFGLARDIIIATIFPKAATDAFFVAFTIPNVLRRLLAEGALTVSFIPVFSDYRKKSREESVDFVSAAFTVTAIVVAVVSIIGILVSPLLVWLFAAGYRSDPVKFSMTVDLTRIMFPYIFFVSLMALSMGVLNTLGHFVAPAAAPVFLNLTLIIIGVASPFIAKMLGIPAIHVLAWGVLLGGIFQFLVQLPPMVSRGHAPKFKPDFRHPGVKKILLLMGPSLFGLAVYQVTIILSRLLASFLESGANSYMYYSQRLIEFPMGVFAVAIATAAMPNLSSDASDGQIEKLKQTLRDTISLTFYVIIPSMIGLLTITIPIVAIFFQRGRFDYNMTIQTSKSLAAFALGLPAMALTRQLVPAFYALKDSKTPVKASFIALLAYIVCGLSLMWPLGHAGLALAITVSSWVNAVFLIFMLNKKIGSVGFKTISGDVLKMCLSAAVMGLAAWICSLPGNWKAGGNNKWNILILLFSLCVSGIVYFIATGAMGLSHSRRISATLKRKILRR